MLSVCLPGASSEFPKNIEAKNRLVLDRELTIAGLRDLAAPLAGVVSQVFAGQKTSQEMQDVAVELWPQAAVYRYLGDRQWQMPGGGSAVTAAAGSAAPAGFTFVVDGPEDAGSEGSDESSAAGSSDLDKARKQAKQHIYKCYQFHSWGKDGQKQAIAKEQGGFEALLAQFPELADLEAEWLKAERQGDEAARLTETLKAKLKTEGEAAARSWMEKVSANTAKRIGKSLDVALNKALEYKTTGQQKKQASKGFKPSIPAVMLENGRHPHAIQNLEPSPEWTLLIDESGLHFGSGAEALSDAHKDLGRMVALLLPQGCSLPSLKAGFHATDEGLPQIETVLGNLMKAPVGILGFTSKDPVIGRFSWFEKVEQLVRWVLLLLPMNAGQVVSVRVLVENRSNYSAATKDAPATDLAPVAESLQARLAQIAPERYQNLRLHLGIIDKTGHPANGYVDTLANCWAATDQDKRKLLNLCKLPGYCLIRPFDDASYERLLMVLESQGNLRPADWFALQQEGGDYLDSAQTLVHSCLQQLGERAQADAAVWQPYLHEVQQRLRSKEFQRAGLGRALDWLERFAPQHKPLPANLKLRLLAARLAHENHLGRCDLALVGEALKLANSLRDEMAPEACELILRMAVSATNAFDFTCCEPVIDEWLQLPVATVGLLNHAKLHSTKGQLLAFQGKHLEADACFLAARCNFDRMADPEAQNKDRMQTRTYQLFARLRNPSVGETTLKEGILEYLHTLPGNAKRPLFERLACSGQSERFAQQLALRAMVERPQLFAEERQQYLDKQADWKSGEDHPWPLVMAYRGWLLLDAGQPQAANDYFDQAVVLCQQAEGATLDWMAAVLAVLGNVLGAGTTLPAAQQLEALQRQLPQANSRALRELADAAGATRAQQLTLLEQCLPFNLH